MTPAEYDAWYGSPQGRWIGETEWRAICCRLDLKPGTTLLDVGCGTGWFTRRLADADLLVTGLDIDTEALDYARTHSPQNVSYLAGDGRSCPSPTARSSRRSRLPRCASSTTGRGPSEKSSA